MRSRGTPPRPPVGGRTSPFFLALFASLGLALSSPSLPSRASFQCHRTTHRRACDERRLRNRRKWRTSGDGRTSAFRSEPVHGIERVPSHRATEFRSSASNDDGDGAELAGILRKHGFGARLATLTRAEIAERPVPAEIYEGGGWKVCLVRGLRSPSSEGSRKPPLLDILVADDDGLLREHRVVDIGQITTLWQDIRGMPLTAHSLQSSLHKARESLRNNIFPAEKAMQNLYNGRIANRSRPPSHANRRYALTKKQIPKIASQFSNPPHLEQLLRGLLKVGEDRMSRLVDSAMATDYLYSDYCRDGDDEQIIRRMVAAQVLTDDAVAGGRFKRRPCQFVSARYGCKDGESDEVEEVTLLNGGWAAVDPSVKAGVEGRKFAATTSKESKNSGGRKGSPILTAADERIAHRLECLSMGDAWRSEYGQEGGDERTLELDVREALTSMNLPLTPNGAASALERIGRWSASGVENDNERKTTKNNAFEPWSPELLDAARSLALSETKRRESLAKNCLASKKRRSKKSQQHASLLDALEGRADLSSLPCVCVDAKRAVFRDDSVGIRLRSSTGRRVNKSASKWEVLVHIADVSDLYCTEGAFDTNAIVPSEENQNNMRLLREAAERRGQSRYDLPLGPLHLLPPVALTAMSLATNKENTPNICVTLWAYIDERDGKLLEAGLERTIISSPTALSFSDATSLLETNSDKIPKSLSNAKAILSVAERNLSLWSARHRQRNQAAQKREKRLSTKELISKELSAAAGTQTRDDGVGGSFQRSRGHRMVDSSLDLYAFAVGTLMSRAKQPIPRAAGSGAARGGRLGTAPLRRYIDGIAQRQALSVLCGYGKPLTKQDCLEAAKVAARASDNIANVRSSKQTPMAHNRNGNYRRQVSALYKLARHLDSTGGIQNQRQVKALSTGHNNEVVILGAGATARCKGVRGTLKSGEELLVRVDKIDPEVGVLSVSLVS